MPRRIVLAEVIDGLKDAHEGQRPTGLGFALADGIRYLDPGHWDHVTRQASVFLTRDYLAALEDAAVPGLRHRYALIFRGRAPVAAVAAQALSIDAGKLTKPAAPPAQAKRLDLAARRLRGQALEAVRVRVLVCGNLFSWGPHGVAFAAGEDPAALWPAVAEALHRIRKAETSAGSADCVLVKDLPEAAVDGSAAGISGLRRFGYRSMHTEPEMVLDIPAGWRGYDDYLAGLNKKYRKAAAQIAKDLGRAGCRVEVLQDLDTHAEALHGLYKQVESRAGVRPASLPAAYLPALARGLGPGRFRCTVVRQGEQILGFVTSVRDSETLVGYYLGLDGNANAELPVYFRLLHALVAEAIETGCRRVSFGRTALEAKARLGCRPVPFAIWARHRVPFVNAVVEPLLRAVPHEEAPQRSPFKDASAEAGGAAPTRTIGEE